MYVRGSFLFALFFSLIACQKKESALVPIHSEALSNQVLNGVAIGASEHPSVGLVRNDGSICTGTLIGSDLVLTADHCVDDERGRTASLALLEFTLDPDLSTARNWNRVREVRRYTLRDIAILQLERPYTNIPFSEISLDALSFSGLYQNAEIVGYGNNRSTIGSQNRDQGAGTKRKGISFLFNFSDGFHSLVSRPAASQVICPGDSGGPLFLNVRGRRQLVGVANSVLWRGSCATVSQSYHSHVAYGQTKRWLLNQLAFFAKRVAVTRENRPVFRILGVPSTYSNATCDVPLLRCKNARTGTSFLSTQSCGNQRTDSLLGYACRGTRHSQSPAGSFEIYRLDHRFTGESVSVSYTEAVNLLSRDRNWFFVESHGVHVLAP